MARRGKGEGSIFQRADGTWCARIEVGRDSNGKRIRKDIYRKTKREVQVELTRLQIQRQDGKLVAADSQTVDQYLNWWLDNAAVMTVRPKTLAWYRQVCNTHLLPCIGAIKLQKLSTSHVQTLMAGMMNDGKSVRLIDIVYSTLHRALAVAVKQGIVGMNVAMTVQRPKVPKHEIKPLNSEQCGRLLESAAEDRLFALYVLALTTGCRQGELFGLEWGDIDLEARALQIRRTLVEIGGVFSTNEPKTKAGLRLIELPEMAVAALWHQKKLLLSEGLAASKLVFCDSAGNPLRRSNVTRRSFRPILKAANLPVIRFHDLRHSSATLLLSAGTHPKIVQERLGHSQIAMTMDLYSHCTPSLQKEAAGKLEAMLNPKPDTKKETG